jgi:DNA polymerase III subunit gamma/tau
MNYTVIARRWRPKTFEDVVGQGHIVKTIRNAIRHGRIAHGYLFYGPRGCGKTSVARILAKAVNCSQPLDGEPCNACPTCKAINGGGLVDVVEMDAATYTGIDDVRELRETAKYSPLEGNYRVFIIDEAHRLSKNAWDGLLKMLEEPSSHVIFVLATTADPNNLPQTILSRVQRFDFRRIREADMVLQLRKICDAEGVKYDEKIFSLIAREADGSLRDAESLLDQIITYGGEYIAEKDVLDVIGLVEGALTLGIIRAVSEQNPKKGLELIEGAIERGYEASQIYKALVNSLRSLLLIKLWGEKPPFLILDESEVSELNTLGDSLEYYDIQNMLNYLLRAEDLIGGPFPKIALEILFINLYNLSRLRDVEKVMGRVTGNVAGSVTGSVDTAPVPSRDNKVDMELPGEAPGTVRTEVRTEGAGEGARETVAESPAPQTNTPLVSTPSATIQPVAKPKEEPPPPSAPGQRGTTATEFLEYLKAKSPFISSVLESLEVRVEDGKLIIVLDKQYSFVKQDANIINELKKRATQFFGKEVTLQFSEANGPKEETLEDYVKEAKSLFNL